MTFMHANILRYFFGTHTPSSTYTYTPPDPASVTEAGLAARLNRARQHQATSRGRCRVCGQGWPCEAVSAVYCDIARPTDDRDLTGPQLTAFIAFQECVILSHRAGGSGCVICGDTDIPCDAANTAFNRMITLEAEQHRRLAASKKRPR